MQFQIAGRVYGYVATFIGLLSIHASFLFSDQATTIDTYLNDAIAYRLLINPTDELAQSLIVLELLNPTVFQEGVAHLDPSVYLAYDWSTENSMTDAREIIRNNLLARVREYKCSSACEPQACVPYRNFWFAALGGHLQQDKVQNLPDFRTNDWGFASGFDLVLSDWLSLGIAGGYIHSDLKWDRFNGSNSIHNFFLGPYVAWNRGCWAFEASILKGTQRYRTERHKQFFFMNHKIKNTHYGDSILCHAGLTRDFCWTWGHLTPYLMADYTYIHVNGIKEKGPGFFNLRIKSHSAQFVQGEVGTTLSSSFNANHAIIVPTFKVGYQSLTPIDDKCSHLKTRLTGFPGSFKIKTPNRTIYQWVTGLFVNFYIQDFPEVSLSYNGTWGDKRRSYYYTAELDWSF